MTNEELWKKYKETLSISLRQELIKRYVKIVKIVAGRMYNYYGGKVEFDDLVGFGVLGLIDSIDKYDLSRNLKFETYAQIRIKGSIIDNLRKLDWVPRSLRKKAKEIEDAVYKLENALDRRVANKDIAEYLNISEKELEDLQGEICVINVVSLEEFLSAKIGLTFDYEVDNTPEKIYEEREIKEILIEAINELPKKERQVISMYYYNELTYKEIGKVLNLSESRISQLHSKAIMSIKHALLKKDLIS